MTAGQGTKQQCKDGNSSHDASVACVALDVPLYLCEPVVLQH